MVTVCAGRCSMAKSLSEKCLVIINECMRVPSSPGFEYNLPSCFKRIIMPVKINISAFREFKEDT